ncbi:hypothetical protein VWM73_12310, partial [Campylobacter coli]
TDAYLATINEDAELKFTLIIEKGIGYVPSEEIKELLNDPKFILKNKLDVYTFPVNKNSDVISVDIFYKVGSRNEIMGKSGIAHM